MKKRNIDKAIQRLVPFFGDDLITFSLWEEGDYRPLTRTWAFVAKEDMANFDEVILRIREKYHKKYGVEISDDGPISVGDNRSNIYVEVFFDSDIVEIGDKATYDPTVLLNIQCEIRDEWEKLNKNE